MRRMIAPKVGEDEADEEDKNDEDEDEDEVFRLLLHCICRFGGGKTFSEDEETRNRLLCFLPEAKEEELRSGVKRLRLLFRCSATSSG